MSDVRAELDGRVLVLTIDRPHARNALAASTMAELDVHLAGVAAREDVRCAVITGAGDRAFIAGGDLKELESARDEAFGARLARDMRRTLDRIAELPIPVIAAVNGAAIGGGAEVAVACDFRIAADDAGIGFTQALLGVMPAWGGIERLGALVGRGRALYLLTTGRVLSGAEAAAWGLVEECTPRAAFAGRWRELGQAVAAAPRHTLAGLKAAMHAAHPGSRPELAEPAIAAFARAWAHPDHWSMAEELERRRRAARERRDSH
ncbi:MAG TPA: enoyl-CoA hydratase/isomerase family protein [Candidatus Dormibacteraeota bacterium]|nr:enoyl-CoA hydratase/isomerase family protein [Candidatus Dormibacteraeota bacterium]